MYRVQGIAILPKGAAMDLNLMSLRQRATEAAIEFILAQRAYLKADQAYPGKSQAELKEAAKGYFMAAEPYEAALQELREYLLAAEPSEATAGELERTERLIKTLYKEKKISLKLIKRHAELITNDVKLT